MRRRYGGMVLLEKMELDRAWGPTSHAFCGRCSKCHIVHQNGYWSFNATLGGVRVNDLACGLPDLDMTTTTEIHGCPGCAARASERRSE